MKVTLKEKRFLIVWIGICSFAYFVNLANIRGKQCDPKEPSMCSYFWTSGYDKEDFYPFTTFFESVSVMKLDPKTQVYYRNNDLNYNGTNFHGIFNSFDLFEFISYALLGFAIIFIPKIWK